MFQPVKHETVGAALRHALIFTVGMTAGLTAFVLALHWFQAHPWATVEPPKQGVHQYDPMQDRHSAQFIFHQHRKDCWRGNQERKADLPGAAIIQFPKGKVIYTKNHHQVDAAFNEVLASIGYGTKTTDKFDVVALCK